MVATKEYMNLEHLTSPALTEDERVRMGERCTDADDMPRMRDAGQVIQCGNDLIQIMHNGLKVIADGYYGPWMTELIRLCRGVHEPQEEKIFAEVLRHIPESATIVELGGFWAYYSLWFLFEKPGKRRAFLIEPDTNHIKIGLKNAELNNLEVDFTQGFVGPGESSIVNFQTETAGILNLFRIPLAKFIDEKEISTLDILHCDVQGVELSVIESCSDLLTEGRIRFVCISTHAHQISGDPLTHQRCLALIRTCGGLVLAEHDVHESFTGDGFIAAYFGKDPLDWPQLSISYNRYSQSLFRNPLYDLAKLQEQFIKQFSELERITRERDSALAAAEEWRAEAERRQANIRENTN